MERLFDVVRLDGELGARLQRVRLLQRGLVKVFKRDLGVGHGVPVVGLQVELDVDLRTVGLVVRLVELKAFDLDGLCGRRAE